MEGDPAAQREGCIDFEVLCGCVEGLTDSVALLFTVSGVTQRFLGAF